MKYRALSTKENPFFSKKKIWYVIPKSTSPIGIFSAKLGIIGLVCSILLGVPSIVFSLFNSSPFLVAIQIVDWNNKNNQEIYDKGGVISLDGKKEYSEEVTLTNNGDFTFNLPASYNKKVVRVYLESV